MEAFMDIIMGFSEKNGSTVAGGLLGKESLLQF